MSDKRAWGEEFNSLKDFTDVLNTPNNSSGMFGRTAAATIIELEAERDALKAKVFDIEWLLSTASAELANTPLFDELTEILGG